MNGSNPAWRGVFVVSVTPFDESGQINEEAFAALLDTYVADGVDGVVVAGIGVAAARARDAVADGYGSSRSWRPAQ